MTYIIVAAAWIVLSFPCAILAGRFIKGGK